MVLSLLLAACGTSAGDFTGSTSTQQAPVISSTSTAPLTTIPEPATTVADSPTTTAVPAGIVVEIRQGAVVGPDRIEVTQGETVTFTVLSDVADHVHVHGYDLFFELVPFEALQVSFEASVQGQFEVELESTHLRLFVIEVTG